MDYTALSIAELAAAYAAKRQEALDILAGTDEDRVAKAQAIQTERVAIKAAHDEKVAAETEAAQALADLNADLEADEPLAEVVDPAADPEPDADPDAPDAPAEEPADAPVVDITPAEPAAPAAPAAVPVAAATRNRARAAAGARPAAPAAGKRSPVTIVAAANVPDFNMGTALDGLKGVSEALVSRSSGFAAPNGDGRSEQIQKFPIAKINIPFEDKLRVGENPSNAQSVLTYAQQQDRLESDKGAGSLVAAGGWCAPSETMYDLCEGETLDGILSLPEVQVGRGGINYTSGPQFADFYGGSGPGFIQTEAQAIAGTAKTCVQVSCPTFQEVRLDAIGLCIKTPLLTESAYPELVERFTRGSLVAFEHQINANVIARMEALSNANRTIVGLGAALTDTLEGLELLADEKREKYRLGLDEALEVVIPFWVKAALKSDLRRRFGQTEPVTDAQLMAYFAASNLNVQFVYDWQPIGQTALTYPTTYRVLMYKAGTFVRGTTDVINLSAVYDAASLATNTYTGLFMEKGLLVARMCWDADRVTLPICTAGRQGAANLTCS